MLLLLPAVLWKPTRSFRKYVENDPACAINELLTLEQIGKFDAQEKRGEIPEESS